jgi:hypothetical protein
MSRKIFILLIVFSVTVPLFSNPVFTQSDSLFPRFSFLTYIGVVAEEEIHILEGLRNNQFHIESLRLTRLAHETFEFGDYDASAGFAEEAIRFAALSDEYVSEHLIAEAKRLLDWADANNIQTRFPNHYIESRNYYEISVIAHASEVWIEAIDAATRSIGILAELETTRTRTAASLPSQYTVRTWAGERDCLWNIAGYPWVYGDPRRWRVLYDANRSRMPEPDNPNLILPGFVLDIPSIEGEVRQGMWDPN